jgi:TfoX/Sxy family transcriptional regulator of competence genes
MAYNTLLANRIRIYLHAIPDIQIEEKKMFGGIAFMVNGKMCVNVSGENLMCRFDPKLTSQLEHKNGYMPMIMKGKEMNGYCYVKPEVIEHNSDLEWWLKLCLAFNQHAKASKK